MGVIIEGGPIWSIDWHKSFVPSSMQKGKVLGMVALACGSGDVLVFCVPKPQGKEHVYIKLVLFFFHNLSVFFIW